MRDLFVAGCVLIAASLSPCFARADTWTYDLGPNRLLVVITLDGGRVVSIERGGFGAAN